MTLRWIATLVILFIEFYILINLLFYKRSKFQSLIKDQSIIQDVLEKSYSYSRSQLLWWTVIIMTCLSISFLIKGNIDGLLDAHTLVLLGISVATTTTGTMIDKSDVNNNSGNNPARHQDNPTRGFIADILSDENGISIHRFQAVIFNIVYGFIFIIFFIENSGQSFYSFDDFALGLIGLSSAGFITLKFQENRK
jgi:SNF family Na+-dependent transporter